MLLEKQDIRLKYVISNRRIGSGPAGPSPGMWRKYSGVNPHDHHCHVSIIGGSMADDTRIGTSTQPSISIPSSSQTT
jgi:hypothetical protein